MALKLANNASTLLAASIDAVTTTLVIASGDEARFPALGAGDWFPITVVDASANMEIMRCTARSGVMLTVARAQEGTTAKAFDPGARVDMRPTAGTFNAKADADAVNAALEDKADNTALGALAEATGEALDDKADKEQLDGLLPRDGSSAMTGDLDMGGKKLLNADWSQTPVGLSGVPIGSVCWFMTEKDRPGYIRADGRSFDPLVYPELAAEFPSGTVPNIANRVMRMVGDDTPAVGEHQDDAMQRITGSIGKYYSITSLITSSAVLDGAFVELPLDPGATAVPNNVSNANGRTLGFDSGNSPGARVSDDETRVKSIIGVAYIKAYGALIGQGTADLVAIEQAQQHMVRMDEQTLSPEKKAQIAANLGLPISRMWESAPQVITSAGSLTLAHDLGVVPTFLTYRLQCLTAEHGYAIGDEVDPLLGAFIQLNSSNFIDGGVSVKLTDAQIVLKFGSASTIFYLPNASTGARRALTNANWNLIVRAFA